MSEAEPVRGIVRTRDCSHPHAVRQLRLKTTPFSPGANANADAARWYVVRDLGTALGQTARLAPRRGDPLLFARNGFISGVSDGFVTFDYHGWHQELFKRRVTPDDVAWACELVGGLTDRQWQDAFRAGGFDPELADRFILIFNIGLRGKLLSQNGSERERTRGCHESTFATLREKDDLTPEGGQYSGCV